MLTAATNWAVSPVNFTVKEGLSGSHHKRGLYDRNSEGEMSNNCAKNGSLIALPEALYRVQGKDTLSARHRITWLRRCRRGCPNRL